MPAPRGNVPPSVKARMRKAPPRTSRLRPNRGSEATQESSPAARVDGPSAAPAREEDEPDVDPASRPLKRASSAFSDAVSSSSRASRRAKRSSIARRPSGRLLLPRRQDPNEHPENHERQRHEQERRQQALLRREGHLVGRIPEEALGEELAADDDVPPHREDAHESQRS